ncbi:DEAD/DEAH box helicase [Chitinophaga sp. CC14]|uniref:SNF2-related protein n=1 Tax=Chitinophaga sp. CC14 TaxID=3029199 RepID=UPI003B77B2F1
MIYKPHNYQGFSSKHIIDNPAAGLFLDMGLGKTVSTLTAIDLLIYDSFEISKVLVIAPKHVAEHTWSAEIEKWDHLRHLKLAKILGTETQRKKALLQKADIYIINRENVVWLISHLGGSFPFDMLVIDELSSFKDSKSARFKALRTIRPRINRVVGLTGTPGDLVNLWPQIYLLDQGERLGKTITGYRDKYLNPGKRNGHVVYEYKEKKDDTGLLGDDIYKEEIYEKIGDICISMKAEDYLELPPRIDRDIEIVLPPNVLKQYQDFERKQVLAMEDVENISAVNAAALSGKLWQFANGAVYGEEGSKGPYHEVHTAMLEALEETLEAVNGQPMLLFYWYKSDLDRIKRKLKGYNFRELRNQQDIEDWNAGKIEVFLLHPASAGHGLNLQSGGHHSTWFGPLWSLELYLQALKRLDRQGQTKSVINTRFIVKGTIHEDMVASLNGKNANQDALMLAIKARINKYLPQLKTA